MDGDSTTQTLSHRQRPTRSIYCNNNKIAILVRNKWNTSHVEQMGHITCGTTGTHHVWNNWNTSRAEQMEHITCGTNGTHHVADGRTFHSHFYSIPLCLNRMLGLHQFLTEAGQSTTRQLDNYQSLQMSKLGAPISKIFPLAKHKTDTVPVPMASPARGDCGLFVLLELLVGLQEFLDQMMTVQCSFPPISNSCLFKKWK